MSYMKDIILLIFSQLDWGFSIHISRLTVCDFPVTQLFSMNYVLVFFITIFIFVNCNRLKLFLLIHQVYDNI